MAVTYEEAKEKGRKRTYVLVSHFAKNEGSWMALHCRFGHVRNFGIAQNLGVVGSDM